MKNPDNLINSKDSIQIKGEHYPWGLYIGELRHPARGRLVPAIIENRGSSIFFEYAQTDLGSLVRLLEDLVSNFILSTIENQMPIINILDLSLNNPFTRILQLNHNNKIAIKATQEEFDLLHKSVKQLIRQRKTEVLDSQLSTIARYNEQCDPRAQEAYYVNVINFNDYVKNPQRLYDLEEVLSTAEAVGIKFLFYVDKKELEFAFDSVNDEKLRANLKRTAQSILDKYPSINIVGSDIFLGSKEKDNIFQHINTLVRQYNLTLELSQHAFDNTTQSIDKMLSKLSAQQDKPFLKIEVGVSPNGKVKRYFELGESNSAYHAFIIGKTGTGKTVFLDHIIKGIALQFSPAEAEVYLFDYKEGIGFAKYASLPHTRVLMLDHSNNTVIYHYMKQFQALIAERGRLFTASGVEKLSEYNAKYPDKPLSQVYLIVDEVQKLFKGDDDGIFKNLIEDVARRGRSVGLTMIMATQTLGGYSIPDVILSQFGLKIAFRVDSDDAISFFSIGNNAPMYLQKRECITNDQEGVIEANKKVLVNAPIPDSIIDELLLKYGNSLDKVIIDANTTKQQDSTHHDTTSQAQQNMEVPPADTPDNTQFNDEQSLSPEELLASIMRDIGALDSHTNNAHPN